MMSAQHASNITVSNGHIARMEPVNVYKEPLPEPVHRQQQITSRKIPSACLTLANNFRN